jgi:hypothetical protein
MFYSVLVHYVDCFDIHKNSKRVTLPYLRRLCAEVAAVDERNGHNFERMAQLKYTLQVLVPARTVHADGR